MIKNNRKFKNQKGIWFYVIVNKNQKHKYFFQSSNYFLMVLTEKRKLYIGSYIVKTVKENHKRLINTGFSEYLGPCVIKKSLQEKFLNSK